MLKVTLNLLGVAIFFLNRFQGRKDKEAQPDLKFWVKDNWVELVMIGLIDASLMLLLIFGGVEFSLEKIAPMMPDWLQIVGDLGVCWLIGLVLAWGVYEIIRKKQG